MNVKTAFLYNQIDMNVWIEQFKDFEDNIKQYCKLNKALYELK